ncbi:AhpC/TSA family protein [Pedobacter sp. MC2016-14]|uniref:AhpC/TSA family protein n=1 Tax=Pedobacter sp. MC2016-14 TaxID=2897327 RepID=UPI001E609F12|nr:AhpC/TSA family protein [Pedobacter sp. MC2016-14]MCD0487806.1 AhpC/TSA family protein [Pedobacter sp. MC2016-14]
MKKAIIALMATIPCFAAAQQQYTINGTVANVKLPAIAFVAYKENDKMQFDSAVVQPNGKFVLKGTVSRPMKAVVMLGQNGKHVNTGPSQDKMDVYLESGNTIISTPDSLFRAKLDGTPLNKIQQELVSLLAPFKKTELQLFADFKKAQGNMEEQLRLEDQFQTMRKSRIKVQEDFIKSHSTSLVSINLLQSSFNPDQDSEKAAALFNSLSPTLRATAEGKIYSGLIDKANALTVGHIAPDFTLKNTKDEDVSLTSFRGRYVLVDFWASWCGPCRRENPNVVKAYEKYKAKNFTILGVSLDTGDDAKEKWMEAINKDGLVWEQVSDLRGWDNYAARLYHIEAIPANFLLDPTGNIIGKNLYGKELEAKLEAILL